MNHETAVKELQAAIVAREARLSELAGKQETPAKMEAIFFEAETVRDEVSQLQKAIEILAKEAPHA